MKHAILKYKANNHTLHTQLHTFLQRQRQGISIDSKTR